MTSSKSFWDDPEVKAAATRSTYAKFEKEGDKVEGTVSSVGLHTWPDESRAIQIQFSEQDVPTVTASQVLLMQALFKFAPEVGDQLRIELIGVAKTNGRTLKKWRVWRKRGDDEVTHEDQ